MPVANFKSKQRNYGVRKYFLSVHLRTGVASEEALPGRRPLRYLKSKTKVAGKQIAFPSR